MSGIEVVGLILGVIPLLISGLEHYQDGVRTIQKWRSSDYLVKDLSNLLHAERDIYLNTCEELLVNVVPSHRMQVLLNTDDDRASRAAQRQAWKSPELANELKKALGRSYNSYLNTACDMQKVLNELRARLEIDSSGEVRRSTSLNDPVSNKVRYLTGTYRCRLLGAIRELYPP